MVSVPALAENKPWVVSADALHYVRPVSKDHTLSCPSPSVFPDMSLLLRNADSAEVLVSGLQK